MEILGQSTHRGRCRLVNSFLGWLCQFLLGCCCLGTLLFKRYIEVPKRPWLVWFYDVGKQACACGFAHILNVVFGIWLSTASGTDSDECAWYCVNFTIDAILGAGICVGFLRLSELLARHSGCIALSKSGDYGDPPSFWVAVLQLVVWIICFGVMKTSLVLLIYFCFALRDVLDDLAVAVFGSLDEYHPNLELTIVMVGWPLVLNTFYFWLMDRMIKAFSESYDCKQFGQCIPCCRRLAELWSQRGRRLDAATNAPLTASATPALTSTEVGNHAETAPRQNISSFC
mmetsp:Transcript_8401/g.14251  ORF Transcript_8401/g.14251 Transcript_8401/m.14251 type:complete len:286 (+) Transcript_8401:94-951(+)